MPAKYIIHVVGPIWNGGKNGESELLYSAYKSSHNVDMDNDCHSIGFTLIAAGIYGYPLAGAWEQAAKACNNFIIDDLEYNMNITFTVLDDNILSVGQKVLEKI